MAAMSRLPDPGRGRWRRTRTTLATIGTAALAAQLVPWVHALLVVLVVASWTVIGLLMARALGRRYRLSLPAWVSVPVATRTVAHLAGRLAGRLRARPVLVSAPVRPAPVSPPLTAEQDWYELVGGPAMSSAGER